MTDDLHDIDPEIAAGVLAHADDFLRVSADIDAVVIDGQRKLAELQERIETSGGSLEDFQKGSNQIQSEVSKKLAEIEARTERGTSE